jgi:hypothetical protein
MACRDAAAEDHARAQPPRQGRRHTQAQCQRSAGATVQHARRNVAACTMQRNIATLLHAPCNAQRATTLCDTNTQRAKCNTRHTVCHTRHATRAVQPHHTQSATSGMRQGLDLHDVRKWTSQIASALQERAAQRRCGLVAAPLGLRRCCPSYRQAGPRHSARSVMRGARHGGDRWLPSARTRQ